MYVQDHGSCFVTRCAFLHHAAGQRRLFSSGGYGGYYYGFGYDDDGYGDDESPGSVIYNSGDKSNLVITNPIRLRVAEIEGGYSECAPGYFITDAQHRNISICEPCGGGEFTDAPGQTAF